MKCAICGNEITGYGNNPWPIRFDPEARCCDDCNSKYVIIGRLAMIGKSKDEANKLAKMFDSWDFTELQEIG